MANKVVPPKRSFLGTPLPLLNVNALFPGGQPDAARPAACTLLTLPDVHSCLHPAISHRYNKPGVKDSTDLRSGAGLGLDDVAIQTDLFGIVVIAVHDAGCRLRFLTPATIVACKTVGNICSAVWSDLSHP